MYRYSFQKMLFCSLVLTTQLAGFNRSLFFRTSSFWGEPRFVKPWLTSFDTQLLGGSSHRSRDCTGKRRNLLSLYGPENVKALSRASTGDPLELNGDPQFINFRAVTDIFEADFNLYQNLKGGFFLQFHLPVMAVRIFPSGFTDNQKHSKRTCKHYTPIWERSVNTLDPFLEQFDLKSCCTKEGGLSDATLYGGWSYSFEDTCYIDFIDTTIKSGVLFPTGRKRDPDRIFDIPFGYNGFYAIPFWWDLSLGVFDWFTIAFHSEALFFREGTKCLRMRTPEEASTGLIVLNKGKARVKPGIVWRLGTYFKADHFFGGLSLLLGFSYEQKNRDKILPCDTEMFVPAQVNNDERFRKWARSIVHLYAEYDFTKRDALFGTRVGFFYNHEMTGLRVFNVGTGGGYLGIDVTWCF